MSMTDPYITAAPGPSPTGHGPGPRFAFAELACIDPAPWLDYFGGLGFQRANDGAVPGGWGYDLQRGTARMLVTQHGDGSPGYDRARAVGDHVSEIGLAYPGTRALDRAFSAAERAGLRSPQRWASVLGGASYQRVLQTPDGLRYSLWDASAGFSTEENIATAPCTLDHIALAVPAAEFGATVTMYQHAFGYTWHPEGRTSLPGGEAMDSGWLGDGAVRITLVTPAPACAQLDEIIAAHGGQTVVQHWAFDVPDLVTEVRVSRDRGVRWLAPPPGAYYEALPARLGHAVAQEEIRAFKDTGILVSATGLRQEFTVPPTGSGPFAEGIQRTVNGITAEGFGGDNIDALARAKRAARRAVQPA